MHNSTQSKRSTINANAKYRTILERDNKKLTLHIVNYNIGQRTALPKAKSIDRTANLNGK